MARTAEGRFLEHLNEMLRDLPKHTFELLADQAVHVERVAGVVAGFADDPLARFAVTRENFSLQLGGVLKPVAARANATRNRQLRPHDAQLLIEAPLFDGLEDALAALPWQHAAATQMDEKHGHRLDATKRVNAQNANPGIRGTRRELHRSLAGIAHHGDVGRRACPHRVRRKWFEITFGSPDRVREVDHAIIRISKMRLIGLEKPDFQKAAPHVARQFHKLQRLHEMRFIHGIERLAIDGGLSPAEDVQIGKSARRCTVKANIQIHQRPHLRQKGWRFSHPTGFLVKSQCRLCAKPIFNRSQLFPRFA